MNNKNLTVLIGSCDKYEPLWKPFQICFNKYWNHDTKNIFVTETKNVPLHTTTTFQTVVSNKEHWGERMLDGIKCCNTDYIFFVLEDYFFNYSYSEEQISEYISFMRTHRVDRMQIAPSNFQLYHPIAKSKYVLISSNSMFSVSLQPSIWNKQFLQSVLFPEYSPWDFEIEGTKYINTIKQYKTCADLSLPNVYFNAVRRGFVKSEGWEEFRINEGLEDF